MHRILINLAEIHYEFGLISHDEYHERIHVALWLADTHPGCELDPRTDSDEETPKNSEYESEYNDKQGAVIARTGSGHSTQKDNENWLEFICLGTWVFTKADPDSYPSVPHGHYKNQNTKWPKLNPYTGRVFSSKHQEDISRRLSKKQMREVWSDPGFKSFCREMIVWYREVFPCYEFPVRSPLRMPRW